jgi:hypothetical protein
LWQQRELQTLQRHVGEQRPRHPHHRLIVRAVLLTVMVMQLRPPLESKVSVILVLRSKEEHLHS